jgi:hypothetical protein
MNPAIYMKINVLLSLLLPHFYSCCDIVTEEDSDKQVSATTDTHEKMEELLIVIASKWPLEDQLVGSRQLGQWVARQSPAGKDVSTEAR